MTILSASDVIGLEGVPASRMGVWKWLRNLSIRLTQDENRFTFHLSDLPEPVRLAYVQRECERAGLPAGVYDDQAHEAFADAKASMRVEAERKAAIARLLLTADTMLTWPEKVALVASKFGKKGVSVASLRRYLTAVEGVYPINFAPALLAAEKCGRPQTYMSPEAWSYYLTALNEAGEDYPLRSAWRDVRDLAPAQGWRWPSRATVFRRWQALTVAEQLTIRVGPEEAARRLAQPAMRDKTSILPLEWVSLDGRTQDFWAMGEDGKVRRYTFLALVDCASNAIIGWELAEAENARSTVRLIRRTCEAYGIFDRLYTDNSRSFSGHLVAGGAVHKFRNSASSMALSGVKPLGICHHLGIAIHFATPRNGQAKIAERSFASLSRVIEDRPEFKGAHAGHSAGASPDGDVRPIALEEARRIIEREVNRYNAETGRRGQGMRGRSYREVFEAGMKLRQRRVATARQLYLAGLIYTPVAVDRFGRVTVDDWTYGDPDTQEALLDYHKPKEKVRILLGRNPDDFDQPALAYDEAGNQICDGIQPVKRGAYGSVDGIRDSKRYRKAMTAATRRLEEAGTFMDSARFKVLTDRIPDPGPLAPAPASVVSGQFGGTLKPARLAAVEPATEARKRPSGVPEEMMQNFRAALDQMEARRR
jgi:putative transposase